MVKNFRHFALVVNNLENSLIFYESLGYKFFSRNIEENTYIEKLVKIKNVKLEWIKLKLDDDSILELLKYHRPDNILKNEIQKSNNVGWSHMALTVSNIEKAIKIINENGGYADKEFQYSPDGKVKVLYCNDNEGNLLEIVEEIK